ncbi:hypothetical protein ATO10_03470 [Actibacterium atlanticum]|uniref:Gamma-glutamyl kinase n=1 Tax=Actibacterium atlanticum TaxID=1461693 RepID=A0A058ZQH1_9RHOB|nr:hypothetical protein [Actibacterium atlanticum]KCV83788.1 hypothetical protein ATO10_03470 [Actibacterium atlanticum]
MMLFREARLVFLCVPKTGTEAYMESLKDIADFQIPEPPQLKHMRPERFNHEYRAVIEADGGAPVRLMAVIREPISWLRSWYRYRQRADLDGHPNSTAHISFDQFVLDYMKEQRPSWAHVGQQSRFVSDATGKILIDHLFAYEQLDQMRAFLSDALGRKIEEPTRRNVSPDAEAQLSPALEEAFRLRFMADFKLHEAVLAGRRPERI